MELVDLIGLLLVYSYVGSVVLIAIRSKYLEEKGWNRKFIHIMIGNIVFFWWIFQDRYVMAFLAAAPFIPILLYSSLKGSKGSGGEEIGPISLRSALIGASMNGHRFGLVYYAISWTILAFLLFDHRLIASIAIVSMAYGDGMGGLIGKMYGKKKLLGNKTLEGSSAAMVCSAVAILVVIGFYGQLTSMGWFSATQIPLIMALLIALVIGLFVSYVELITPGELDNLVIPFSVGFILLLAGV
jgi:phytol kinase